MKITTLKDLIDKLDYIKKEDLKVIESAYFFASQAHENEKRINGDNYIIHPLNVAYILSDIKADYQTISSALLHDTLDKHPELNEELKKEFSNEIYELVTGVVKINKLNFFGDSEVVIENHKKILVGLSKDVRVIIIKLVDRLDNMRTIWALTEDQRKLKAKETLDILVPIAHRLGMNNIKSELEDLSLRYLKPEAYYSISEKLNQTKVEREALVEKMIKEVSDILTANGIKHKIKGRAKAIYSIYTKLNKGRTFDDIYDLLALRVFVDTENECYQALGLIHAKYKPVPKRFKDYIAMPKSNMYQSLHTTVFGPKGNCFEIQIRTEEMDRIAENGIASHWSYKEGGKVSLQSAMEQKLQFFKSLMNLSDEEETKNADEEMFKDSVYVFTPNGDAVELPIGSTPIDFAYKVHTQVGNKMVGAIVNNTIVSLDYELQDNDIVKINTNNTSTPSKEWINIAKTNQAKNKIRAYFSKIEKKDYLKIGTEMLAKELRKKKISSNDFLVEQNISKVLTEFKLEKLDELYIAIASNKIPVNSIINTVYNKNLSKEEIILKKTENKEAPKVIIKDDIIVKGIDKIKVNIAACCMPIPGDKIIGYITKGNGISVHKAECPNILNTTDRIINVEWNDKITKKYPTNILIHTLDNKNVLLDVIAKTSNNDIVVQSTNFINNSDNFLYEITVLVRDVKELEKYIEDLKSLNNVIEVERSMK